MYTISGIADSRFIEWAQRYFKVEIIADGVIKVYCDSEADIKMLEKMEWF